MVAIKNFVQRLQFTSNGLLRKITGPEIKLSKYYIRAGAQESVRLLRSVGRSKFLWHDQYMKSLVQVSSSESWGTIPASLRSWRRPSPTSTQCSELRSNSMHDPLVNPFQLFFTHLSSFHKARTPRCYYYCAVIIPPVPRCYYYNVQIFCELDFFFKKRYYDIFFIIFCKGLLKFSATSKNIYLFGIKWLKLVFFLAE